MFSTNKTKSLLKKSGGTMDIFRKMLADITAVTQEMTTEDSVIRKQQVDAQAKVDTENALRQADRDLLREEITVNNKISTKIETFWDIEEPVSHMDTTLGSSPGVNLDKKDNSPVEEEEK